MNRLKLPLFIGLVIVTLMCSCSYASAGPEPNLALGMFTVNNGQEAYVAVAAEMPILTIAEENTIAIRTSSSAFSPMIAEKLNAVMNVVGSQLGRNPVIIGNDAAVQNVNSYNTPAIYARNLIREEKRSGSSTDAGEAILTWKYSSVVKMPIDAAISPVKVNDVQCSSSKNEDAFMKSFALYDKIRAGDMLGRYGGINNNIKAGINPVIKAVIVHGTIEV